MKRVVSAVFAFASPASLLILVISGVAFGQGAGAIAGNVLDLSGNGVAKAPVQATNVATKAVYKATSSDEGTYTLAALPAGAYDVAVAAPGYFPFSEQNLMVRASETSTLISTLPIISWARWETAWSSGSINSLLMKRPGDRRRARRRQAGPDRHLVRAADRGSGQTGASPLGAEALRRTRGEQLQGYPGAHCLTRGITLAGTLFPYELVQTPARLLMLFEEGIPIHRTAYLDGRRHPKDPNPDWMGHSIGHWEGDMLVVDTIGFNDKSWLDAGHGHTDWLHVTERIHRPDLGHLEIEFTIDDSGAYAKPWIIKRVADLDTRDEIGEYVCTEGERDAVHMVGK